MHSRVWRLFAATTNSAAGVAPRWLRPPGVEADAEMVQFHPTALAGCFRRRPGSRC
ncbi:MAG: hypothetical protein R2749_06390 [Acidimicrobiales bacterium]